MITKYSIKAFLREDKQKKDGSCPVNFRISFSDLQRKKPIGVSGNPKNWNKEKGEFIKAEHDYLSKNRVIAKLKSDFDAHVANKNITGENIDCKMVDDFFCTDKETKNCFYFFFEEQIRLWKGKKKESTLVGYGFTLSVLKQFKSDLSFEEINLEFVQRFEAYMRTKRGVRDGGAFNRLKHLRAVIREGIRKDKLKVNPFSNGNFVIKRPECKSKFLTGEDIKAIENADVSNSVALKRRKDMFLFCCYTGLRYSDMQGLKWEYITGDKIQMKTQKTGSVVDIPLVKKAKRILIKQEVRKQEFVFERISSQKINYGLKKLLKKAGIEENFTFHDSRHAFACLLVANEVPLTHVRDLMGHSSIKETDKYAKVAPNSLRKAIEVLDKL